MTHATAPTGATPLLSVRELLVEFDTPRGRLRAVDGVSFEIAAGETVGIVGESGSGKSLTVRSIMGLLPRSATVSNRSVVEFEGRDLRSLAESELRSIWGAEIAMVFQDPMTALTPVVRIGRQITEPVRRHMGVTRQAARARAVDLLTRVGVPDADRRLRDFPHNLSGGMRQRVMIAIALSCQPALLIADEPTTALDVTIQRQILNLLSDLQREQKMAMILVTHDLGVVGKRTERTIVMYAGRIVERARTGDLFAHPRHPYTQALLEARPRLGDPSGTPLHTIPGRPPVAIGLSNSCPFAPRCPRAQPRCAREAPPLETSHGADHWYACFYPLGQDIGQPVPDVPVELRRATVRTAPHGRDAC